MTTMRRAVLLLVVAVPQAVAPVEAQREEDVRFPQEVFASLGWLAGRWVGSGGGFDAFYEEYRVLNDSTLEQRTFPDSTFADPDGVSTIEWRGGVILKQRAGDVETRIVRIAGDTVRFESVRSGRRGFTWFRLSRDEWRAVLDRPGQPVVYTMRRWTPGSTRSNPSVRDAEGVRRAALDYLDGFYQGDDAKLRRSVHAQVDKFGYFRRGPGEEYRRSPMSFEEMFGFAAAVRAGRNLPPEGAPKEVILLDVQDQTAVAKVVAWWGQDYLHMARIDGRWMIVHVLWQSLDRY